MRLVFVQTGDYRNAVLRFAEGGPEYYRGQRQTVGVVGNLSKDAKLVATIAVAAPRYEEMLPDGTLGIGMKLGHDATMADVMQTVDRLKPTHFVCRSPWRDLLQWATTREFRTLPLLADSFIDSGPRSWWRNRKTGRTLNHNAFRWITNHNVPACWSLARIGVNPNKIVPYDFESSQEQRPDQIEAKTLDPTDLPFKLFYVGALLVSKGVGDAIDAVQVLRGRGRNVILDIAGSGRDEALLKQKAEAQGLMGQGVTFLGRVPNTEVISMMNAHHAVLVPSRPSFNEGLPIAIVETLCSRSPLIASDHPMFRNRTKHEENALVFRAGHPKSLADQVERLMTDPGLYAKLSNNAQQAWDDLQIPVGWADFLTRWIRDHDEDREYFNNHSLASGIYPPN